MTTKVGTNGATTLSRMNFSGYVGHATIVLFSSRVRIRVRVRFSVWLVNGYAHVFVRPSIVAVANPEI